MRSIPIRQFAAFGVIDAVAVASLIAVILPPIILATPGRRVVAAVWIASLYPALIIAFFYMTWLTAWCVLGYRPRVDLDDPKDISPIVDMVRAMPFLLLLVGSPLIWFVVTPITLVAVYWNLMKKKTPIWRGVLQLLIPVCAWMLAYAFIVSDPDVVTWFFD